MLILTSNVLNHSNEPLQYYWESSHKLHADAVGVYAHFTDESMLLLFIQHITNAANSVHAVISADSFMESASKYRSYILVKPSFTNKETHMLLKTSS